MASKMLSVLPKATDYIPDPLTSPYKETRLANLVGQPAEWVPGLRSLEIKMGQKQEVPNVFLKFELEKSRLVHSTKEQKWRKRDKC